MSNSHSNAHQDIIIVDDDILVRNFVLHTFQFGLNHKIVTFGNGFHAWQYIQDNKETPHFILADVNIPEMNGLELLCHVKKQYQNKKVAITTSNPDLETKARHWGADAFVLKPFDVKDLIILINAFLNPLYFEKQTVLR